MKKEDMKKDLPIFIIVLVIISSATFFIGTKVSGPKDLRSGFIGGDVPSFDRGSMMSGNAGYGLQNRKTGSLGGMISGEILSKDDSGVTIKLRNGGSKIVFISDSTIISKSVVGTKDDVIVGNDISVVGKTNTDGSIGATTIDIREQLKAQ